MSTDRTDDHSPPATPADGHTQRKPLPSAAARALAEAAARRAAIDRKTADRPKEVGGPEGPEPTRYGDWERKGLASDF